MSDKTQRISGLLLLVFGSGVLALSLLDANKVSVGDTSYLLARKVYIGKTILPDNIFYPFLMVADRIKLNNVSPAERVVLEVEYADRRFRYAVALLNKNEPDLALTTVSKSQKYLFAAGDQIFSDQNKEIPQSTVITVRDALDHSIFRLEEFKTMTPTETSSIDDLIGQSRTYLKRLDELESSF